MNEYTKKVVKQHYKRLLWDRTEILSKIEDTEARLRDAKSEVFAIEASMDSLLLEFPEIEKEAFDNDTRMTYTKPYKQ